MHSAGGKLIRTTQIVPLGGSYQLSKGEIRNRGYDPAYLARVASELDVKDGQQLLCQSAYCHPRCRLSCAGAFEHEARIVQSVLCHSCVVGMAWSRDGEPWHPPSRPAVTPILPISIGYAQRYRCTGSPARQHPAQDLDLIMFDPHPLATAIAALTSGQITVDRSLVHSQARWHSLNNGRETRAMGFTGG